MKHEIHRLQPVLIRNRCVGHLLQSFKGVQAFNANDKPIGVFPDADEAVRRLRTLASQASTQ